MYLLGFVSPTCSLFIHRFVFPSMSLDWVNAVLTDEEAETIEVKPWMTEARVVHPKHCDGGEYVDPMPVAILAPPTPNMVFFTAMCRPFILGEQVYFHCCRRLWSVCTSVNGIKEGTRQTTNTTFEALC